jgi:hypothetical protein
VIHWGQLLGYMIVYCFWAGIVASFYHRNAAPSYTDEPDPEWFRLESRRVTRNTVIVFFAALAIPVGLTYLADPQGRTVYQSPEHQEDLRGRD